MATLTKNKTQLLMGWVGSLTNPYDEFTVQQDYPGIEGYILNLKTNVYIHRKHTSRDLFVPHSVYQVTSCTALPSKGFMKEWLKNAREASQKFLNKGDYSVEEYIGGEWQSVKRKYNRWIYYDRHNQALFGEVHRLPKLKTTQLNQKRSK